MNSTMSACIREKGVVAQWTSTSAKNDLSLVNGMAIR